MQTTPYTDQRTGRTEWLTGPEARTDRDRFARQSVRTFDRPSTFAQVRFDTQVIR